MLKEMEEMLKKEIDHYHDKIALVSIKADQMYKCGKKEYLSLLKALDFIMSNLSNQELLDIFNETVDVFMKKANTEYAYIEFHNCEKCKYKILCNLIEKAGDEILCLVKKEKSGG